MSKGENVGPIVTLHSFKGVLGSNLMKKIPKGNEVANHYKVIKCKLKSSNKNGQSRS